MNCKKVSKTWQECLRKVGHHGPHTDHQGEPWEPSEECDVRTEIRMLRAEVNKPKLPPGGGYSFEP